MANYRGPSKNRRSNFTSLSLVEQLIQNMIDESMPTKVSELDNDSGYITVTPVLSVNGFTGSVVLPLFSGSYIDLTNKPTIPTVRRVETFSGVTDASGNYTVTYSPAYPAAPHVTPVVTSGVASQTARVVASTNLGFTINVTNRASVNLLGIDVLLSATVPVASAPVSVEVLARS